MTKSNKFSPEVRERAVRMVQGRRADYRSLWVAIDLGTVLNGSCQPVIANYWKQLANISTKVST